MSALSSGGVVRRRVIPQMGWTMIAFVAGFLILWPILQLQLRAFADGGVPFAQMLAMPTFKSTVYSTILLAVCSTIIAVIVGTAIAWCASLLPARFQKAGQFVPLMPLVLPAVAAVSGYIFLLSPRVGYINALLRELPFFSHLTEGPLNVYSLPAMILITGLLLSAFVYLFVQTGLQNMGQDLEAAAAASGASPVRTLFTITLPLLRPSIIFSASIVFLIGLGQFTVPLLLGRTLQINVLTTEMFYLTLEAPVNYGLGAALGSPVLMAGIVLVLVQKFLLGEQRRFVVVSARSRNQARETRWWSVPVVAVYALLTTILPIVALVYVSLQPFWSSNLSLSNLTLQNYEAVLNNRLLMGSITTSVVASVLAVIVVIPLGFACAYALLQTTPVLRPIKAAIETVVTLPMAIPASLMGFGILFAYSNEPFSLYGTSTIIVVTYVTLMIGYSTRLQSATLLAMGTEFREASMTSGAGPLRTLFLVMFPMARKGMAAAAALTFVMLSHEFSASMMVRSVRTQVMGSMMYDIWSGGIYPEAAVMALIMVVVTIVGVIFATWVAGSDSMKQVS